MFRVEVVAEAAHPPQVGHPVERHATQRKQLPGVVVVPGQTEAVTGQVEVADVLTTDGKLLDRSTWKCIIIYPLSCNACHYLTLGGNFNSKSISQNKIIP